MLDTFVGFSDLQTSRNIDFAPQNVKEFEGYLLDYRICCYNIFQYVSKQLAAVLQLTISCLCENALKY